MEQGTLEMSSALIYGGIMIAAFVIPAITLKIEKTILLKVSLVVRENIKLLNEPILYIKV